jgi:chemotaxis protein methyltransferase CheR
MTIASAVQLRLSDATFTLLREHILVKTGIFLGDGKKYLVESRLVGHLADKGFTSFEEYYQYLKRSGDCAEEESFFDAMTTNETYFFRDSPQLDFFEKLVVPMIKSENAAGRKFRIWSAGCSSGEEPYTLAVMVKTALPGITMQQLEIIGTDLSKTCLGLAKAGIYSAYSIRNMPEAALARFFLKKTNEYCISREIRELVRLDKLNLSDQLSLNRMRGFNLIFCKNVFIYFSDEVRMKIAGSFNKALLPGGMLVLGPSEYLKDCNHLFAPQKHGQCVYYRKV